jgi:molybdopterin molybdotransferase
VPADPHAPPPMSWAAARTTAYEAAAPAPGVRRPLADCAGATLAEPLTARIPLPPWDIAAMDGFAVAGSGPWALIGEVLAGDALDSGLRPGQAVAIGTGARLPTGTTAVLQVEHAEQRADLVHGEVEAGRHVRPAGEECAAGEQLLPAGAPVTAAVLGLAAACGHDELLVRLPPEVLALVTGDELLAEGVPRDGRVRDALGPQLPLLVAAHGGRLAGLSHLRDESDLLRKAIDTAEAPVVVVTGASSAGPADHLRPVLGELGAELLVDGVACRPGSPQLLARLSDGRLVVGLPGNPLAALAAAGTVLAALLAGLAGRELRPVRALAGAPLAASASGTRLVPVRREGRYVHAVPGTGAGMLRGAALADALAVVPPGADLASGEEVELLPLP